MPESPEVPPHVWRHTFRRPAEKERGVRPPSAQVRQHRAASVCVCVWSGGGSFPGPIFGASLGRQLITTLECDDAIRPLPRRIGESGRGTKLTRACELLGRKECKHCRKAWVARGRPLAAALAAAGTAATRRLRRAHAPRLGRDAAEPRSGRRRGPRLLGAARALVGPTGRVGFPPPPPEEAPALDAHTAAHDPRACITFVWGHCAHETTPLTHCRASLGTRVAAARWLLCIPNRCPRAGQDAQAGWTYPSQEETGCRASPPRPWRRPHGIWR